MTVREALLKSINTLKDSDEEYHLKSLLLLSYILGIEKEQVFLRENEVLNDRQVLFFEESLKKLEKKYPLPYITEHKEFMNLDFYIEEGVLVPRQETETLVEIAIKKGCGKNYFLDIGCGSGVIVVSILYYCKNLKAKAIDISEKALKVTGINAKKFDVETRITLQLIDYKNLDLEENFDFIVSNPPYVRKSYLKNLPYEPKEALDGGDDGFKHYPSLIEKSISLLKTEGFVLYEIDTFIADKVFGLMSKYFKNVEIIKDLAGNERFVYGEKQ